MKRRGLDGTEAVGIPVTPLIDIVFLLLIYFMLASNFVEEQQVHLELPESSYGQDIKRSNAVIAVTRDGRFFLEGREVSQASLPDRLKAMASRSKLDMIEISSDRLAPMEFVIKAMDAAKAAGITRVLISTKASGSMH